MRCKYCGGRKFRCIVRYIKFEEYDKNDNLFESSLEDCLGEEENSYYCVNCERDLSDDELI